MEFRVGLLFYSIPGKTFNSQRVLELLEKIDHTSKEVRGNKPLTLVPFIRDVSMQSFVQSVVGAYSVQAASFDEAGVSFASLDLIETQQHAPHNVRTDFDLGMRVLLWRCAVIIVVCHDATEAEEVNQLLKAYANTFCFLAVVPSLAGSPNFVLIGDQQKPKDEPSWLIEVEEHWEIENSWTPVELSVKWTFLGFLFPLFNSALIGRRSETIKKGEPTREERCRGGMGLSKTVNKKLNEQDRVSLDALLKALCPSFAGHDELGKHYSNTFRTTCFLVPLIILVSTVLAVAASVDTARHDVWHLVEVLLLVIAVALFGISKIAKQHQKWVENRLIAELLRPTLLNAIFHTIPRLDPPSEEPRLWVDRSKLLLRHFRSLPPLVLTTPAKELLSARVSAINDFSKYQADWHTDFAGQHRDAEKRLTRISAYAFIVTLVLCIIQLLLSYGVSILPSYLVGNAEHLEALRHGAHVAANVMMMLTLFSAGCAFLVLLLSHQLGFEAIAERSSNAANQFASLQQSLEQSGYNANASQVYAWASECAAAILNEQHSWYRQIPLIRMHL